MAQSSWEGSRLHFSPCTEVYSVRTDVIYMTHTAYIELNGAEFV